MKLTTVLLLVLLFQIKLRAQTTQISNNIQNEMPGIQWAKGLTWKQVREKAKKENKYIFLDCYATWCVPCKRMELEVFSDDSVAYLFNSKFISIKVQMDRTKDDDNATKLWYDDVEFIQKEYRIRFFPTYVFLSPQGVLVNLEKGYRKLSDFLSIARQSLNPNQVYIDPNREYYKLVSEYSKGGIDYSKMLYLIKKSKELGDNEVCKMISKNYLEYLNNLKIDELFTKEHIEFLATSNISSKLPLFRMFYVNKKEVDSVMGQKGFATKVVDNCILTEIVLPFFKNIGFNNGGGLMNAKTDLAEADWNGLYHIIKAKYNRDYALRNVLNAKVYWYDKHNNLPSLVDAYFMSLKKYGIDQTGLFETKRSPSLVNEYLWRFFLRIDNKRQLNVARQWMSQVVKICESDPAIPLYIDTYANLCYKVGRKKEAIEWEEKCIKICVEIMKGHESYYEDYIKEFAETLNKMKTGKATWN